MSVFTPFPYRIYSSMMALFYQFFLIPVDLLMYSLRFMYANLITFKTYIFFHMIVFFI